MKDFTPEIIDASASFMGSLTALLFMQGSKARLMAFFGAGMGFSLAFGPWFSHLSSLPSYPSGWVLGTFGMALVTKVFMTIDSLQASSLNDWIRKLLKLDK